MTGVRVIGRGSMLVHLRFEPFVIAAQAARCSTRIRKGCRMALSTAGLDIQFLHRGSERRNRRAPHRTSLCRLWQTPQVSCNLCDLLIAQILVRHKGGHNFSSSLTNNAQKLSRAQLMSRERLGKSSLASLA